VRQDVTLITEDGESLDVSIEGQGQPIVLLHEWAADARVWGQIQTSLSAQFQVYAWTARGHGGPLKNSEPVTIERLARDLNQMISQFGMDRPILVGHSMGALTLWQYIDLYSDRGIGRLCLIDQSPRLLTDDQWQLGIYGDFPPERNQRFLDNLAMDFPETVLRLIAEGHNQRARELYERHSPGFQRLRERLQQRNAGPLIDIWRSLAKADFRPVLPKINVPTLLIYGEASNYYGPAVANYVARQIPSAQLHLYAEADHSPHQGQRERFLADLSRWLA